MGNIRPTYIKRVAVELVEKYPRAFSADFENNKVLVQRLTNVSSIMMRNRIAGYVRRYWQNKDFCNPKDRAGRRGHRDIFFDF